MDGQDWSRMEGMDREGEFLFLNEDRWGIKGILFYFRVFFIDEDQWGIEGMSNIYLDGWMEEIELFFFLIHKDYGMVY
jgi:hypothetical protein